MFDFLVMLRVVVISQSRGGDKRRVHYIHQKFDKGSSVMWWINNLIRSTVLLKWGVKISKNKKMPSSVKWQIFVKHRLTLGPIISRTKCDRDKTYFCSSAKRGLNNDQQPPKDKEDQSTCVKKAAFPLFC